jgi:hypothetical protein
MHGSAICKIIHYQEALIGRAGAGAAHKLNPLRAIKSVGCTIYAEPDYAVTHVPQPEPEPGTSLMPSLPATVVLALTVCLHSADYP